MKKIVLICTILLAMVLCFGCGYDTPDEQVGQADESVTVREEEREDVGVVYATDGFANAGFVEAKVAEDGKYYFTANGASKDTYIAWEVYVFNNQFEDALRYVSQSHDFVAYASIKEEENLELKAGQYIYIYCSQNAFTCSSEDEIASDACLTYSVVK